MTDLGELRIIIQAVNATAAGVAGAQRNVAALDATTKKVGRNWQMIGLGMQNVGRSLTRYITVPSLAAGAASVDLALKFDASMTRVAALTNTTGKAFATLRQGLLNMAPVVGQSPKALADALYFIASQGYRGATALNILKAAAKGSAIGLGDVNVVANAGISALKAYTGQGLTVSKAFDTITKAVVEGKMQADAFAGSLGRILPVAAALGINFGQVAGALAVLSRQGMDTMMAVTSLRSVLIYLEAPTAKVTKAITAAGFTVPQVRQMMAQQGILSTLTALRGTTGNNLTAIKALIPNMRALPGFLALTNPHLAAENQAIVNSVVGAQGTLNRAFAITARNPAQQLKEALASLEKASIMLGNRLLPPLIQAVHWAVALAAAFTLLPKGVQSFALVTIGLATALGPAMQLFSGLARGVSLARGGLGLGGAAATAAGAARTVPFGFAPTAAATAGGIVSSGALSAMAIGLVPIVVAAVAAHYLLKSRPAGNIVVTPSGQVMPAVHPITGGRTAPVGVGQQITAAKATVATQFTNLVTRFTTLGATSTAAQFMGILSMIHNLQAMQKNPIVFGKLVQLSGVANPVVRQALERDLRDFMVSKMKMNVKDANAALHMFAKDWNPANDVIVKLSAAAEALTHKGQGLASYARAAGIDISSAFVSGLVSQIRNGTTAVRDAAAAQIRAMIQAARAAARINTPSLEAMDLMASWNEGLILGLGIGTPGVTGAIGRQMDSVVGAAGGHLGGKGGRGREFHFHFHGDVYGPDDLIAFVRDGLDHLARVEYRGSLV